MNKYIIITILFALLFTINGIPTSYSEEGQAEIGCIIYHIAVNPQIEILAFGVIKDENMEMIVTDYNLNEITRFSLDHAPCTYEFSRDGTQLYIGLYDFDYQGTSRCHFEIRNCSDWSIENAFSLPHYPEEIYIPQNTNAFYITCAYSDISNINLLRYNISDGSIIQKDFGEAPACGIAMNHDESKLYVYDSSLSMEFEDDEYWNMTDSWHEMHGFNPNTLDEINSIRMDCYETKHIVQGPPGYLLIAHSCPNNWFPTSISVFNTNSDEVERIISFEDYIGCRELKYDPIRNCVYALPVVMFDYYDPEIEMSYKKDRTLNKVAIVDLSTDTVEWSSEFPETVGPIAISNDYTRLFACSTQPRSEFVFYLDL